MNKEASITVSQEEANKVFSKNIEKGEKKKFRDLVQILKMNFLEINSNQCSGIINRAHAGKNPILEKEGKTYSLLTKHHIVTGLEKVKAKIQNLISEINEIPISEFHKAEDFESFKRIQKSLDELTQ